MAVAARFLSKRKAIVALAALDAETQVVRARISYAYISRVLHAPIPVSRDWFDNVLPEYNDRDFRRRIRMARPTFYALATITNPHCCQSFAANS